MLSLEASWLLEYTLSWLWMAQQSHLLDAVMYILHLNTILCMRLFILDVNLFSLLLHFQNRTLSISLPQPPLQSEPGEERNIMTFRIAIHVTVHRPGAHIQNRFVIKDAKTEIIVCQEADHRLTSNSLLRSSIARRIAL